ncbi:MAG: hypothetical protein M0004_10530 [Actinomycetota bacterium]|nr:hypothetical protein [Actinomycetota bacterium]
MHPIEQLRAIARSGDIDHAFLAIEAADALAELASEPRALVPACRRLLEHHRLAGPLWWLCAQVLGSPDPAGAAEHAAAQLIEDPTADELAGCLPGAAVVAAPCSATVCDALAARPDCHAHLVGDPLALRRALRAIGQGAAGGAEVLGYSPSQPDEVLDGASLLIVEPAVAGPSGAILSESAATLAEAGKAMGVDLWLVAGVGKVLPAPLFANCLSGESVHRLLAVEDIAAVIGPGGPAEPAAALAAGGVPSPPELAYHPAGG